ncbi:MAG TPA: ATPase [Methanothermobacter sp.]|nr:RAD55 family ATPase [Methanothermobacter tenebrarum]MDD3454919.1 RAD55 family ATPase [Methanobacteriales archaeon]MDX9692570.1 RAD55 family ATPase [Methanothermobacter sp.]HHW16206.1 ATPase [Methanothermobacter sp.]HOQ20043.1 RAD55 family ATPase [Methanothermobacter sp.]
MKDQEVKVLEDLLEDVAPGDLILVHGPPKVGKSIFCYQFLYSGLEGGEPCLYIVADYGSRQLEQRMMEFNWFLRPYIQSGDVYIIDLLTRLAGVKVEDSVTLRFSSVQNLTDLMVKVGVGTRSLFRKSSKFRSVLDSLTMMFAFNPPSLVLRLVKAYKTRISEARGIGVVVHTIGTVEPSIETSLMDLADLKLCFDGEKIQIESSAGRRSAQYTITDNGIEFWGIK